MAKSNPYAWFPSPFAAQIRRKKVDRCALSRARFHPYFDTWEEARAWLQSRAVSELAKSAKALESDRKHLEKVLAMVAPSAAHSAPHTPVAAHAVDPSDRVPAAAESHESHDVRGRFKP